MSAVLSTSITWSNPTEPVKAEGHIRSSVSVELEQVKQWLDRESELQAILRYRDDWDGYGSAAPDQRLIGTAVRLLRVLRDQAVASPPARATLSPEGAIAFEWQDGETYLEAQIISYDRVDWMEARSGKLTRRWTEQLFGSETGDRQEMAWQYNNDQFAVGAADFAVVR